MIERWAHARDHDELMFAQLTAAVINTGFRGPEKRVEMKSLMPSKWVSTAPGAIVREKRKRFSGKQRQRVADDLRRIMTAYNAH